MPRKLIYLILLVFLMMPRIIFAQEPPSLTSMTVDLWPEFDRPTMLVMYQFSLSSDVKLPTEIIFRIPAAAGVPNAVAVCEPNVNCYNTPFTQQTAGEWSELTIQATLPDLRVEYYDPSLQYDGSSRMYGYVWPGDFAVDSMLLHVQQPIGAEQMLIKPGTVVTGVGEDGLTYYSLDAGAVPAGQAVEVTIEYTKDNDELTNTALSVSSSEPLDDNSSGRFTLTSDMPYVLGGLGVLLMVGGGLWYWLSGQRRSATQPRKRARHKQNKDEPTAAALAAGGEYVYCHQCGNRAAAGDRFCRTCGTAIRR